VPSVSVKTRKQPDPLERFIGEEARVVKREAVDINNSIAAEWMAVNLPAHNDPEDQGMLYLFPIDDGRFCLQLCYIQYPENASSDPLVTSLKFLPAFFDQYPAEVLMEHQSFRFDQTSEQQFALCSQTELLLGQLQQGSKLMALMRSLQQTETAMHLLRRALECITVPFTVCPVPACRFLAYESERDKIQEARNILDQHLDQPHTIKELARKVAMNECYLKKGFKTLVGKTIHEYQQELRINKARELLQQEGRSVTDVSNTLGFSSISHFSTVFKRVTGLKPCELLT